MLLAGGCVFSKRIASDATDYNLAVEHSTNQLLLLNILRASEQRPMYFTGLSQIRGSLTSSTTGGATEVPIGGAATDVYKLAAQGTLSSNPSFDVVVLESNEFWRGITTPITVKTFKYYQDQGWSLDLLISVLVRKIELKEGHETLVNSPEAGMDKFQARVNELLTNGYRVDEFEDTSEIGPAIPGSSLAELRALIVFARSTQEDVAEGAPKSGGDDSKGTTLGIHRTTDRFATLLECAQTAEDIVTLLKDGKTGLRLVKNDKASPPVYQLMKVEKSLGLVGQGDANVGRLYLRSPEAMLYFLGSLVRAQLKSGAQPLTIPVMRKNDGKDFTASTERMPVFAVMEDRDDRASAIVTVRYAGHTYSIGRDTDDKKEPGGSMHTLSLVHQFLVLQQTSKELPTTAAVTVVGK